MRPLVGTIALTLLACLLLAVPATTEARVIAIADQNAATFHDPLWQSLGITHARVAVAWDIAIGVPDTRIVAWLDHAQAARVKVLVAWTPSRSRLPSRARFRRAFRAFRKRWPHVREFATWNEPNLRGSPAAQRPERSAWYWKIMKTTCPHCRVLGPELVDFATAPGWARRFERAIGRRGITWGLHNYRDANRFPRLKASVTAQMLRAVKGPIWLTEAGGIVRFKNVFRFDTRRAQKATRRLFTLAKLSRRISRVYVYHWRASAEPVSWDSGLLSPGGNPRPAFWVVASRLRATRSAQAVLAARERTPAASGFTPSHTFLGR